MGLLLKQNVRFISSQVILQVLILVILLFFGQNFIPESIDGLDNLIGDNWAAKYHSITRKTVCLGLK